MTDKDPGLASPTRIPRAFAAFVILAFLAILIPYWHSGWTDSGLLLGTALTTFLAASAAMIALFFARQTVQIAAQSDLKLKTATSDLSKLVDRIEAVAQKEGAVVAALDHQRELMRHTEQHDLTRQKVIWRLENLGRVASPLDATYAAARVIVSLPVPPPPAERIRCGNALLIAMAPLQATLALLPPADMPLVRAFTDQLFAGASKTPADVEAVKAALDRTTFFRARNEYHETLALARMEFDQCLDEHSGSVEEHAGVSNERVLSGQSQGTRGASVS